MRFASVAAIAGTVLTASCQNPSSHTHRDANARAMPPAIQSMAKGTRGIARRRDWSRDPEISKKSPNKRQPLVLDRNEKMPSQKGGARLDGFNRRASIQHSRRPNVKNRPTASRATLAACDVAFRTAFMKYNFLISGGATVQDLMPTNPEISASFNSLLVAIEKCREYEPETQILYVTTGLLSFYRADYVGSIAFFDRGQSLVKTPPFRHTRLIFVTVKACHHHADWVESWRVAELLDVRGYAKIAQQKFAQIASEADCEALKDYVRVRDELKIRGKHPSIGAISSLGGQNVWNQ